LLIGFTGTVGLATGVFGRAVEIILLDMHFLNIRVPQHFPVWLNSAQMLSEFNSFGLRFLSSGHLIDQSYMKFGSHMFALVFHIAA